MIMERTERTYYNWANWKENIDEIKQGVEMEINGKVLEEGKHFDVVDMCHSSDAVLITCRGKDPFFEGEKQVVCRLSREDGKLFLTYSGEPLEGDYYRIGDRLYKIIRQPPKVRSDNTRELGTCNHTHQEITIGTGLPPELEQETILHELAHAVIYAYCKKNLHKVLRRNDEENFVKSFSRGWLQMMKQNPSVFSGCFETKKQPYTPIEMEIIEFDKEDDDREELCIV